MEKQGKRINNYKINKYINECNWYELNEQNLNTKDLFNKGYYKFKEIYKKK